MPRPPPPPIALTITPAAALGAKKACASASVTGPALPGITGTPHSLGQRTRTRLVAEQRELLRPSGR